ncbi:unnamed protein product [Miscanthus lutarioriparius]|uniref:Uncharacterized protein n=1 Tax=Miscanthus lutarioriparius TaxID=422564 RepID=A0A811R4J6_9POAL|nr:unnamed protein product [Miscanthus lutarioriparius]
MSDEREDIGLSMTTNDELRLCGLTGDDEDDVAGDAEELFGRRAFFFICTSFGHQGRRGCGEPGPRGSGRGHQGDRPALLRGHRSESSPWAPQRREQGPGGRRPQRQMRRVGLGVAAVAAALVARRASARVRWRRAVALLGEFQDRAPPPGEARSRAGPPAPGEAACTAVGQGMRVKRPPRRA